eukprot:9201981-Lingulodinium_polyedra.AAC.1
MLPRPASSSSCAPTAAAGQRGESLVKNEPQLHHECYLTGVRALERRPPRGDLTPPNLGFSAGGALAPRLYLRALQLTQSGAMPELAARRSSCCYLQLRTPPFEASTGMPMKPLLLVGSIMRCNSLHRPP